MNGQLQVSSWISEHTRFILQNNFDGTISIRTYANFIILFDGNIIRFTKQEGDERTKLQLENEATGKTFYIKSSGVLPKYLAISSDGVICLSSEKRTENVIRIINLEHFISINNITTKTYLSCVGDGSINQSEELSQNEKFICLEESNGFVSFVNTFGKFISFNPQNNSLRESFHCSQNEFFKLVSNNMNPCYYLQNYQGSILSFSTSNKTCTFQQQGHEHSSLFNLLSHAEGFQVPHPVLVNVGIVSDFCRANYWFAAAPLPVDKKAASQLDIQIIDQQIVYLMASSLCNPIVSTSSQRNAFALGYCCILFHNNQLDYMDFNILELQQKIQLHCIQIKHFEAQHEELFLHFCHDVKLFSGFMKSIALSNAFRFGISMFFFVQYLQICKLRPHVFRTVVNLIHALRMDQFREYIDTNLVKYINLLGLKLQLANERKNIDQLYESTLSVLKSYVMNEILRNQIQIHDALIPKVVEKQKYSIQHIELFKLYAKDDTPLNIESNLESSSNVDGVDFTILITSSTIQWNRVYLNWFSTLEDLKQYICSYATIPSIEALHIKRTNEELKFLNQISKHDVIIVTVFEDTSQNIEVQQLSHVLNREQNLLLLFRTSLQLNNYTIASNEEDLYVLDVSANKLFTMNWKNLLLEQLPSIELDSANVITLQQFDRLCPILQVTNKNLILHELDRVVIVNTRAKLERAVACNGKIKYNACNDLLIGFNMIKRNIVPIMRWNQKIQLYELVKVVFEQSFQRFIDEGGIVDIVSNNNDLIAIKYKFPDIMGACVLKLVYRINVNILECKILHNFYTESTLAGIGYHVAFNANNAMIYCMDSEILYFQSAYDPNTKKVYNYKNLPFEFNQIISLALTCQNQILFIYTEQKNRKIQIELWAFEFSLPSKLWNYSDRNTILSAIRKDGLLLKELDARWKKDREIVLEALTQNGLALAFCEKEMQCDKELVLNAIKQNVYAARFVDKQLLCDTQFILKAISEGINIQLPDYSLNYANRIAVIEKNALHHFKTQIDVICKKIEEVKDYHNFMLQYDTICEEIRKEIFESQCKVFVDLEEVQKLFYNWKSKKHELLNSKKLIDYAEEQFFEAKKKEFESQKTICSNIKNGYNQNQALLESYISERCFLFFVNGVDSNDEHVKLLGKQYLKEGVEKILQSMKIDKASISKIQNRVDEKIKRIHKV